MDVVGRTSMNDGTNKIEKIALFGNTGARRQSLIDNEQSSKLKMNTVNI